MRALQGYIKYRAAMLDPIGEEDWTDITVVQFEKIRISDFCAPSESMGLKKGAKEELAALAAGTIVPTPTPTPPAASTNTTPPASWRTLRVSQRYQARRQCFPHPQGQERVEELQGLD
jgi:hypothetical protein